MKTVLAVIGGIVVAAVLVAAALIAIDEWEVAKDRYDPPLPETPA